MISDRKFPPHFLEKVVKMSYTCLELTIPTRDPKESERVTMETTMCVNQAQSYSVFVVYNFTSPYIDYFWLVFGV